MEAQETLTLKSVQAHLTKSIISTVVATSLGIVVICVAFYHNTQNTLSNHQVDISNFKTEQVQHRDQLNDIKTSVAIDNSQINSIDKRVNGIETKVDAIYNILVKMEKKDN